MVRVAAREQDGIAAAHVLDVRVAVDPKRELALFDEVQGPLSPRPRALEDRQAPAAVRANRLKSLDDQQDDPAERSLSLCIPRTNIRPEGNITHGIDRR
jgi:hypothetical protein